jgi:hypothetical protein
MSSMSFTPMHSAFCSLRSEMGAMLRAVVGIFILGTERPHLRWLNFRQLDLRVPNWSGEDRNIPGLT